MSASTRTSNFGVMPDDTAVSLFTSATETLTVTFSDYGARLISLQAPDRAGTPAHVIIGYDSLDLYIADKTYSGALIGRYANRIANGRFSLDGSNFQVPQNDATNALHGGAIGFDRRVWSALPLSDGIEFTLVSPAGDQGFPGTLNARVRYTLSGSQLRIDYSATTDAPTIVNLTNHAYFNLSGGAQPTILDHHISIPAAAYTPITPALVPSGELAPVDETPFDLRQPARIGDQIDDDDAQLKYAGGFDHNWVLDATGELKLAATVHEPVSGRSLTVHTTQPGLQFYSGNFMDGTMPARSGGFYPRRGGLCLETQHFPDSPNHPNFPSTVLRPGETFRSTTIFTFS